MCVPDPTLVPKDPDDRPLVMRQPEVLKHERCTAPPQLVRREEEMACHPAGADPAEPSLSQAPRIESCSTVGDDVVEA